jgi:hypothetical protein
MSVDRGMNAIIADTHRRLQEKQSSEERLKRKEPIVGTQINATSEKVNHDRFDLDFNLACHQLGIF